MHTANVTVEGYDVNSIAIEGSQITYYCKDGLVPRDRRVATCTKSSNWNPDPAELVCKGTGTNVCMPTITCYVYFFIVHAPML